ncbi:MAG: M56 family metallopeptidase, partial [Acetatifactor sp.]|nr:M56 family metallopeptidase [Acetatifactor sp.]
MGIQLIVLQIQIIAAVLFVLLVRLAIRKLPKVYSYILWLLVFARLLCPVALETSFSIMPSQAESEAWVEQALQNRGGVTAPTDMGGEPGDFVPQQSDAAGVMAGQGKANA